MKLIKEYSIEFSYPLANIINRMIRHGEYPQSWKLETVTPVPKAFPPASPKELRKIALTKNLSKIVEKILAEFMLEDMKDTRDPSQYGNEKGLSVQHYLINMINKILTSLDRNSQREAMAVIAKYIDWSSAFDRQCPKLAMKSFIVNGVRPSLIPVLSNYFQNRKMTVKWNGILSKARELPGGGPQGCSMGIISYMSQSQSSAEFLENDKKYKFVDDLSILEIINLVSIGISSYNFRHHVASDIGVDMKYVSNENIQSQTHLNEICTWTDRMKMKLNEGKCKVMIFVENI